MAASPIPKVKRRNFVPSGVRRIDRLWERPRMNEKGRKVWRLRNRCFTLLVYPVAGTSIADWLDRDGDGLDNVEYHTLRLFETLCPHAMGSVQHDAVRQHNRRQLF